MNTQGQNCITNTSINSLPHNPDLKKKAFENIVGKGENAGYLHFLLFPNCFLAMLKLLRAKNL